MTRSPEDEFRFVVQADVRAATAGEAAWHPRKEAPNALQASHLLPQSSHRSAGVVRRAWRHLVRGAEATREERRDEAAQEPRRDAREDRPRYSEGVAGAGGRGARGAGGS